MRGERTAFWLTIVLALPAAALIGFFIHEEIGISQVALFLVIAMVYVTLARGQLVGSSIRVHESAHPELFAVVKRCAAALGIPVPLVFLRDDYFVPVLGIGLGHPYSLVISSFFLEHFREDELQFMIGRELGHIASGHTRFTSLLSVNGNENPIVSLIFGAWLRKCELTCDRVGLLCCGSLDAAARAITIATFRNFGRTIDYAAFTEQAREIEADSILRLGAWIGAMPYATTRIEALRAFAQTPLYERVRAQMVFEPDKAAVIHPSLILGTRVAFKDCAGWWRRFTSIAIDLIVITAILRIVLAGRPPSHGTVHLGAVALTLSLASIHESLLWIAGIWLYFAVLVAIVGQTPGMMIAGLRVVDTNFAQPSLLRSLWRYAVGLVFCWLILPLSPFSRVYVHDRFSGTRLIGNERALARATA